MKKAIVIYYSYEGSTKKVAELIAKETNAKIIAIKMLKESKTSGFKKYLVLGIRTILGQTSKIKPLDIDISNYDLVFIGSPIWAGTFAPPVKTVINSQLLVDKKVAYFYCHEGGAKDAAFKAQQAINKKSKFISALECPRVIKDFAKLKPIIIKWAKDLVK